jgi:hypothetical protein
MMQRLLVWRSIHNMKQVVILTFLFVFLLGAAPKAITVNMRDLIDSPEKYEGESVVLEKTLLDRKIVRNRHFGFYCLDVESQGRHVPGYLYRSQLNFVIFSEELEKKLVANLEKRRIASQGPAFELMEHVSHKRASLIRLTCTIERFRDYWVAHVTRIELYGNNGAVIETIE